MAYGNFYRYRIVTISHERGEMFMRHFLDFLKQVIFFTAAAFEYLLAYVVLIMRHMVLLLFLLLLLKILL